MCLAGRDGRCCWWCGHKNACNSQGVRTTPYTLELDGGSLHPPVLLLPLWVASWRAVSPQPLCLSTNLTRVELSSSKQGISARSKARNNMHAKMRSCRCQPVNIRVTWRARSRSTQLFTAASCRCANVQQRRFPATVTRKTVWPTSLMLQVNPTMTLLPLHRSTNTNPIIIFGAMLVW